MDGLSTLERVPVTAPVLGRDPGAFVRGVAGATAEEAGRRMEALFATMLVKELRRALPNQGFFGTGPGADTYNGWFDEHLGEILARDAALGLAGQVKVALDRRQAAQEVGV